MIVWRAVSLGMVTGEICGMSMKKRRVEKKKKIEPVLISSHHGADEANGLSRLRTTMPQLFPHDDVLWH